MKRYLCVFLALLLLLTGCETVPGPASSEAPASTETAASTTEAPPTAAASVPETTLVPETSSVPETSEPRPEPPELGGYAVSSSTKEATAAGIEILEAGGNAVDAAVAVALALGVTEPYSSGLGGSGVMVVYDPVEDRAWSLDYYACAGAAESSGDAVGVPGYLAGLQEALDRWGTLPMGRVIEPAITLAEEGFEATALFVRRLSYSERLTENPAFAKIKRGSTVVQPALAETLKRIRDEGTEVFYRGDIARDIAAACELTEEDLAAYQVYCEDALESSFAGSRIFTTTAPTSGVVTSQMLTVAELMDVPNPREDPQGYLDVMKLATEIAYKTRRNKLVDPRFYDFDGARLVSQKYVAKLVKNAQAAAESAAAPESDPERRCTTQFSVIDRGGMIVCVTNTLSDNWGGYLFVDGFYLNNTLTNFNKTGKNAYEPGKRPRTHFSPVVAVGEDHFCLAIGSPGGEAIPKIVSQVLIEVLRCGTDVPTAVEQGRYYYDEDGKLCLETVTDVESLIDLSRIIRRGYYYSSSRVIFGCTAIVGYDPAEGVFAAADSRREGSEAQAIRD